MPVRMEKDHPDDGQNRDRKPKPHPQPDPGSNQGGRFPFWYIILAIYAIIKKPKWLIPIVIILGLFYIFKSSFPGITDPGNANTQYDYYNTSSTDQFSFGATLSEEEFDKASVFEPLATGYGNSIPSRIRMDEFAPRILHQGNQGSCSGWASAYGARTISWAKATGSDPDQVAFSPSYLYNQIALPRCEGAYLNDAMNAMVQTGSIPFRQFGYTDQTCQVMPDRSLNAAAAQYRIKGYNRLTVGAGNYTVDINAIKQHLAQGAPVVIGIMVGQSFQHGMMGKKVWVPTRMEYNGYNLGGHAMCVVGYDDNIEGGAFRLMNSWGSDWGDDGFAWVRYEDFRHFTKEAYGIFPEGNTERYDKDRLEVKFALIDNNSQNIIPLRQVDEIVFRTQSALRKGDQFKIALTNSVECYTYVFGMETDGSSYVLFPYTAKHSAYCGITGTRLFPKDYSMTLDEIGNRDVIAVVVSKEKLNFQEINNRINQSQQSNYMLKMVESLYSDFVEECDFDDSDGAIYFNCNVGDKSTLGMVIEIEKR